MADTNSTSTYETPIVRHPKTPREMLKDPLATNCEVNNTHVFQVKRETVAIIFVPGIMGSRLLNQKNEPVWDPDALNFMFDTYFSAAPKTRYKLLISQDQPLKVATIATEEHKKYPKAEQRGWPGVSWAFYGELLSKLHDWNTSLKVLLDLPVYAFGYDWLKSNRDTAKKLQEVIQRIPAQKVILVTHSMGGLVARYALGGEGGAGIADKVLGVIHGAQPVHGAPAAYRRQIAGHEVSGFFNILGMIGAKVLGEDGPSVTAIFPHARSALQLLPSQHYRTNDGKSAWLHIQSPGKPEELVSYPQNGDPYTEIYLKSHHRDYWGMIHGEWFQTAPEDGATIDRALSRDEAQKDEEPGPLSTAKIIRRNLDYARDFHTQIGHFCHPRTMQLFSSGEQTTCTEVSWHARDVTELVKRRPDPTYERVNKFQYFALKHIEGIENWSKGNYSEVRWGNEDGTLGDVVPGDTRFEVLDRGIAMDKRLFQIWMTRFGNSGPGMASKDLCHLGDGTVPLSSATGLTPSIDQWGNCVHMLPTWNSPNGAESKMTTGQSNTQEHSKFFDSKAIEATLNTIHNLCLAWLKDELT